MVCCVCSMKNLNGLYWSYEMTVLKNKGNTMIPLALSTWQQPAIFAVAMIKHVVEAFIALTIYSDGNVNQNKALHALIMKQCIFLCIHVSHMDEMMALDDVENGK